MTKEPSDSSRPSVILDCDPGIDDAYAIVTAARYCDLLGITTVVGNAPLDAVTDNALAMRELLALDVPIHSGARSPLIGPPRLALHVHGNNGFGGGSLPQPTRPLDSDNAVEFIIETVRSTDNVWIVAIGPLTNIALALAAAPDIAPRLAGISFMGGSAGTGNVTPAGEFNTVADPEAAAIVLRHDVRLVMAGLDLTHQFEFDRSLVTELRAFETPVADLLADLTNFVIDQYIGFGLGEKAVLHDPLSVLAVTHPQVIERTLRSVEVELAGTFTRGMTVLDRRRPTPAEAGPGVVEHGHTLDVAEARRLLMDAIASSR